MEGLTARTCALVGLLVGLAQSLPSDALLDSLQLAALDLEKDGRFDERDQTESLLENLARQRVVADSSPEHPRVRLQQLERLRGERAQREAVEEKAQRQPPAEVTRMLADTADSEAAPPSAPAAQAASPTPIAATAPTPVGSPRSPLPPPTCPAGPIRFHWVEPATTVPLGKDEAGMDVKIRLEAPCGLTRIELYADDLPPRSFPVPRTGAGAFEFADRIVATEGIHRLEFLVCDSLGTCMRSPARETRLVGNVPSWVPRAVGGLVLACGLLGLTLFLRRRPHRGRSALPDARPTAVPVPDSKGLTGTLRKRLQQVAQEFGPAFPAISLRLPDHPPTLAIDSESLGDAFSTMLRLHARRLEDGKGQILMAMGLGPVSVEVVFEDTATTPEEGSIQAILDPSRPRVRERMGLDRELELAVEAFQRCAGSVSMEARIDGGLRTRMKIPLGQKHA
jgi:hypothetical protein